MHHTTDELMSVILSTDKTENINKLAKKVLELHLKNDLKDLAIEDAEIKKLLS